ncbi:MAG: ABC transporter ATP-binding protein/permease [Desulfurococcales archaeon]|nr:ABC transporter ATP-binding protein/permease [Desulfurococcales archaeon]
MAFKGLRQLRRLLRYLSNRKVEFTVAMVLVILMSYTNSIVPVLIRGAIDYGIIKHNIDNALIYGGLIILAGILNGIFSFSARFFQVRASQDAVYRLRMDTFRAIQRQNMEFFDKTLVGQLISRVTNDAERITGFLSFRMRMLVYSSFLVVISLYYMYTMSSKLALIAVITILIVMSLNAVYARKVRPIYDKVRHQTGVLAGESTSSIAGIKTVKALAVENYIFGKFGGENRGLYQLNVDAARISSLYGNSPFLIIGLAMSAMLFYGGEAIIASTLTVGELTAFLTYMLVMMWPLRALGFIIGDMQRTLAAANRLFEIIDTAPAVIDSPDAVELGNIKGEILFDGVWFSYPAGKKVLQGITFKVKPGEKLLITGPPGTGKSTILKLIARLYTPTKGKILLDGIELSRVKQESLRKIIAYVPQEPFIFNRSLRENISLAKPDASLDEIMNAASIAKIHEFIKKLPNGYDAIVGERGITLSGGQRQRIAIARALLANPKLILLDDPVSNLDAETEEALVNDLKEILADKTAVIVSQRLSLAKIADRIIVLSRGMIVEEGKHEELLARKGVYYELYKSMTGVARIVN